jgi:lipid-A-disaccharide synthase
MKYYIIAGEASGDLHGSNLIKELKKIDPSTSVRCWGGDLMAAAGGDLVRHYKDLAFMGFAEVLMNLRTIFRNLDFCKQDILQYRPDALILIDYPGFNMRIAKWARAQGLRIIYYISPQVWAWKEGRVTPDPRDTSTKCSSSFPSKKLSIKNGTMTWNTSAIPSSKSSTSFRAVRPPHTPLHKTRHRPPARQPQTGDIEKTARHAGSQPLFPRLPIRRRPGPRPGPAFYAACWPLSQCLFRKQPDLRPPAAGTGRLRHLRHRHPRDSPLRRTRIVCYKGSTVSYQIARRLIRVKYISLVNLIMDKLVVKELIQDDLTPENLRRELDDLLHNENPPQQLQADYRALKEFLSQGGHASANAAASILQFMNQPVQ